MATILGLIPARGGSKGVPGKNIRPMCSRPLLAWTVDAARRSGVIGRILLSTDTQEIADVGRLEGCDVPFLRPPEISDDATPMHAVIEHALKWTQTEGRVPDIIVLLQPTSPLRDGSEIRAAVDLLRRENCDSVISVTEIPRHHSPDFVLRLDEHGSLKPFNPQGLATRRQDARPAFARDGSVYAFWRRTFEEQHGIYGRDCRPVMVEPERSLSIDTLEDFAEAERRLTHILERSA
ncbi:MAG TPA: acylneuraminate cytidylyltransferase family protein [Microvirga sp.]|jgi:CMP-N-acetylneuraminic acid synthetase|nr:acylneuraminate cytidylyltransferase family protein [Microvirga sp.]